MDQAAATLNSTNFQAYSTAIQNMLLSNIDNKDDAIKAINKLYFGNEEGAGDFQFSLKPRTDWAQIQPYPNP